MKSFFHVCCLVTLPFLRVFLWSSVCSYHVPDWDVFPNLTDRKKGPRKLPSAMYRFSPIACCSFLPVWLLCSCPFVFPVISQFDLPVFLFLRKCRWFLFCFMCSLQGIPCCFCNLVLFIVQLAGWSNSQHHMRNASVLSWFGGSCKPHLCVCPLLRAHINYPSAALTRNCFCTFSLASLA